MFKSHNQWVLLTTNVGSFLLRTKYVPIRRLHADVATVWRRPSVKYIFLINYLYSLSLWHTTPIQFPVSRFPLILDKSEITINDYNNRAALCGGNTCLHKPQRNRITTGATFTWPRIESTLFNGPGSILGICCAYKSLASDYVAATLPQRRQQQPTVDSTVLFDVELDWRRRRFELVPTLFIVSR